MASRRRHLFVALLERLRTIAGFDAQIAGVAHVNPDAKVLVEIWLQGEDKEYDTTQAYQGELRVHAQIGVHESLVNDDPLPEGDAGNIDMCVERQVAAIESVVHVPDDWADHPTHTYLKVEGWDFLEPIGESIDAKRAYALVRFLFTYEHAYTDPSQ